MYGLLIFRMENLEGVTSSAFEIPTLEDLERGPAKLRQKRSDLASQVNDKDKIIVDNIPISAIRAFRRVLNEEAGKGRVSDISARMRFGRVEFYVVGKNSIYDGVEAISKIISYMDETIHKDKYFVFSTVKHSNFEHLGSVVYASNSAHFDKSPK